MAETRRTRGRPSERRRMAAQVTAALERQGIDAVLVGGSVVSLYTHEKYVTDDLDFVSYKPLKSIAPVMEKLGYKMVGNRAVHPRRELYVQFCAPPLAVGREPVVPVTVKAGTTRIHTLSPTDCVLDRLMKYYHWEDEQGLEQAVLVAHDRKIDLDRVREVSRREGKLVKFSLIIQKRANTVTTNLAMMPFAAGTNQQYFVRFRVVGQSLSPRPGHRRCPSRIGWSARPTRPCSRGGSACSRLFRAGRTSPGFSQWVSNRTC